MGRQNKLLILVVVGALAIAALPAVVSAAGGTFIDDDTSIFEANIEWMAASGVTKGCSPDEFCPEDNVTRGQMAAFMQRFAGFLGAEDGVVTNADNADNADTVDGQHASAFLGKTAKAADSDKLDGLHVTDLVKAFGVASSDFIDDFTDFPFVPILTDTIDVPRSGFLYITASFSAEDDCSLAGTGSPDLQITVDGTATHAGFGSAWQLGLDECFVENNYQNSAAWTAVVAVSPGSHTIALEAQESGSGTFIIGRSISTLFVPFGDTFVIPASEGSPTENPNRP